MSKVKYDERYYRGGTIMEYSYPYVGKKLHGTMKWWYDNGELRQTLDMVRGKKHGLLKWYDKVDRRLDTVWYYINDQEVSEEDWKKYCLIEDLAGLE